VWREVNSLGQAVTIPASDPLGRDRPRKHSLHKRRLLAALLHHSHTHISHFPFLCLQIKSLIGAMALGESEVKKSQASLKMSHPNDQGNIVAKEKSWNKRVRKKLKMKEMLVSPQTQH
jgi:hypothetical protein